MIVKNYQNQIRRLDALSLAHFETEDGLDVIFSSFFFQYTYVYISRSVTAYWSRSMLNARQFGSTSQHGPIAYVRPGYGQLCTWPTPPYLLTHSSCMGFFQYCCLKNTLSSSYYPPFKKRLHRCVSATRGIKLDLTCIYFDDVLYSSNLCDDDLLSFYSNLYVYRHIVMTTYMHKNFRFVSTYMYHCMIDFF